MHIVKTKRFGASVTTCIPHKEILRAELAALHYMQIGLNLNYKKKN